MKAIVCKHYGPPENLQLQDIPISHPGPGEIRIKVKTTAINDYDWSIVRGIPRLYRLMYGLLKPKASVRIPGMEVAGIVEELGPGASRFQVGDEVYGDTSAYGFGCFAEFLCIDEKALFPKPSVMSFEDAAAIPHAALLAWQGFAMGGLANEQKILINGAGGGVGTLGIQMAKLYDVQVTGVDTGPKLETMKALGFDEVIDYKKIDFTQLDSKYDLILDTKTTRSPSAYKKVLKPGGNYVTVGGKIGCLIQLLLARLFGNKNLNILSLKPNDGLEKVSLMYSQDQLKPTLDGPYPLEQIPDLLRYFGEGKHTGKILISIP